MPSAPLTPSGSSGLAAAGNRYATAVKWVSAVLIAVSALLVFRHLPVQDMTRALEGWFRGLGIWGPVVFGLIYVVAVVLLVPGVPLTWAAGFIFGLVTGTVVASLASTTGAALAFLIARYLARDRVAEMVKRYPRFDAIDKAISEGGWKFVALLRLSPAVPFNLQNYMYGLTGIRFWTCVLTSWLAMLPGTFLYVYLGYLSRAGLEAAAGGRSRSPGEWALTAAGLLATVAVTVYITRLARRAIRERTGGGAGEPGGPRPDGARPDDRPRGWPWGATAAALAALAMVAAAVYVELNPQRFQRLFGPPRSLNSKENAR
jgi:uncharacterized membrane protein YdjX (TVP38/TMEM64 family)